MENGQKRNELTNLFNEENRLKTFGNNWVFSDDNKCSAKKMAEAGFYYTGNDREPDSVECFFCGKSLEGFEEDDDPWLEHINHAGTCKFAKLQKSATSLPLGEYLELQAEYVIKCKSKFANRSTALAAELKKLLKKD